MTEQQQSIAQEHKTEHERELERQRRARELFAARGQWAWVRLVDERIREMKREGKVSG